MAPVLILDCIMHHFLKCAPVVLFKETYKEGGTKNKLSSRMMNK